MFVISLVEKDVFTVQTFIGMLFQNSFLTNTMFFAQFLPEFKPNLVPALPQLEHNHFARHFEPESRQTWEKFNAKISITDFPSNFSQQRFFACLF